jgi:hypothetical protein
MAWSTIPFIGPRRGWGGEGRGGERVVGGGVLKLRFQSGKEEGEVG